MTTPYAGRHAELYDLFYADKSYESEASWISSMLMSASAILDLACGTGGHALALAAHGHRVTGVDISESMLRRMRRKAAERGLPIPVSVGDMRRLPLADATFDAVICLFDSIGYVRTDEGVRAALSAVRRVLKPGGLFVVEFWHKPTMIAGFDPVRVRSWPVDGGRVFRISETELIETRDLAKVAYSIFELRDDYTYSSFTETHVNRYFTVAEMHRFVVDAGFVAPVWRAGFSDESVTDSTWHVVGLVKAP